MSSLDNDAPEKVINEGIIKTVAAFLNIRGGTLAIGITDDGDIRGLQPDLDYKHQDLDGYQNWLTTLLVQNIGGGVVGAHVRLRIESVGSEVVCLVDVAARPGPSTPRPRRATPASTSGSTTQRGCSKGPHIPATSTATGRSSRR